MTDYLPDLAALLPSWQLSLRSEGKAPGTVGAPQRRRDRVPALVCRHRSSTAGGETNRAGVDGRSARRRYPSATAIARFKGVGGSFAKWLVAEGAFDADPLLGMNRPKDDRKLVKALTDEELRALIDACRGKSLKDRRDEAMIKSWPRQAYAPGSCWRSASPDMTLNRGLAVVHRGKGGEGHVIPFGPQTGAALDRYIRIARRELRLTDGGPLWVSRGPSDVRLSRDARGLKARAVTAGVAGFHAHRLRHTAATRWLRAGGSEQGLMSVAGWSSRSMLDRYTGASAYGAGRHRGADTEFRGHVSA